MAPILTSSVISAAVHIPWYTIALGFLMAIVTLIILLILCLGHGNNKKENTGGNVSGEYSAVNHRAMQEPLAVQYQDNSDDRGSDSTRKRQASSVILEGEVGRQSVNSRVLSASVPVLNSSPSPLTVSLTGSRQFGHGITVKKSDDGSGSVVVDDVDRNGSAQSSECISKGCRIVSLTVLFDKDTDVTDVQKILDYASPYRIKLEVEPIDNQLRIQKTNADVTEFDVAVHPKLPSAETTPGIELRNPSTSQGFSVSPNRPAIRLGMEGVDRPMTVTDLPEAVFDLPDGRKTMVLDLDLDSGALPFAAADLDGDESVHLKVGHLKFKDGQSTGGSTDDDIDALVASLDAGLMGVQAAAPETTFGDGDSDVAGERKFSFGRAEASLTTDAAKRPSTSVSDDIPLTEPATLKSTAESSVVLNEQVDGVEAFSLDVSQVGEVPKSVRFVGSVAPKTEIQSNVQSHPSGSSGYVAVVPSGGGKLSGKRVSPKTSGGSDAERDGSGRRNVDVSSKLQSVSVQPDFSESAEIELRTNAGTKRPTVKSTLGKFIVFDDALQTATQSPVGAKIEAQVPTADAGYQMKAAVVDVSADWPTENLHLTEQTIDEEIKSTQAAAAFNVSHALRTDEVEVELLSPSAGLQREATGELKVNELHTIRGTDNVIPTYEADLCIESTTGQPHDVRKTVTMPVDVHLVKSSPAVDVNLSESRGPSSGANSSLGTGISVKQNDGAVRDVVHVTSMQEGILELVRGGPGAVAPKIEVDRTTDVHLNVSGQPIVTTAVINVAQVTPGVTVPKTETKRKSGLVPSKNKDKKKEAGSIAATIGGGPVVQDGTTLRQAYVGAHPKSSVDIAHVGNLSVKADIGLPEVATSVKKPQLKTNGKLGPQRIEAGPVDSDVVTTAGSELRTSNLAEVNTKADMPQLEVPAVSGLSVETGGADFGIGLSNEEVIVTSLEPVSEPVIVAASWLPTGDLKMEPALVDENLPSASFEAHRKTGDGAIGAENQTGVMFDAELHSGNELLNAQLTSTGAPATIFAKPRLDEGPKVHTVAEPAVVTTAKVMASAAPAASIKDEKKSGGILFKNVFKHKTNKKTAKQPASGSAVADGHASVHIGSFDTVGGTVERTVPQHSPHTPGEDIDANRHVSVEAELPAVSPEGSAVAGNIVMPEVGLVIGVSNVDVAKMQTVAMPVLKTDASPNVAATTALNPKIELESETKGIPVETSTAVSVGQPTPEHHGGVTAETLVSASVQQPPLKPSLAVEAKSHKKGGGFMSIFKSKSNKKPDYGHKVNEVQRQLVVDAAAVTPSASVSIQRSDDVNVGENVIHTPAIKLQLSSPSEEKFRDKNVDVGFHEVSAVGKMDVSYVDVVDFDKPLDVHIPSSDGEKLPSDFDTQENPEGDLKLATPLAKPPAPAAVMSLRRFQATTTDDDSGKKTDSDNDDDRYVERVQYTSDPSPDSGEFEFSLGSGGMDLNAETMLETAGVRPLAVDVSADTCKATDSDVRIQSIVNGGSEVAASSRRPDDSFNHGDRSPSGELPNFGRLGRASATSDLSTIETTPISESQSVALDSSDEDEEGSHSYYDSNDLPPYLPPPPPDEPLTSELSVKLANGRSDIGSSGHEIDDGDCDDGVSPRREVFVLRSERVKSSAKVESGGDLNNNEARVRLSQS